ncbi:glycosyltransferase [uncultured Tessaracoccus sp.]|uniref:glycosyltransferase n=1 Tax=uncultured Tessaracoccus sp. TaxID=905023 RepID=UPI00263076CB|nr:glycosyltransferase [uncultured Tessaracoccus sp.]
MIVIVTSHFPFGEGESFIAPELEHWQASDDVVLLPEKRATAAARPVPDAVRVDETLARRWASRRWLAWSAARALTSPILARELWRLARERRLNPLRARIAVRTLAQVYLIARTLTDIARRDRARIDVVYGYWLSSGVMAGAMLARKARVGAALARAHGTDLWEPSRKAEYTPLIRQFAPWIRCVHAISDAGRQHLARYGFTEHQRHCSRLGVSIPGATTPLTPPGEFRVVTLSSMTPFKRLDRAAEALARLHALRPELKLRWTHIGDGPLRAELEQHAQQLRASGIRVDLLGAVPHEDVLGFLEHTPVDVLLNTSDSEGIPVSLMEAMAHGIPAVAPDIGAVRELVPDAMLLPAHTTGDVIGDFLAAHAEQCKSTAWRSQARQRIEQEFDASVNQARFVAHVRDIVADVRGRAQ